MKVAIIIARSGSKRIPKKNIKIFNGKPMIYWSIIAARKTKLFDRVIVSTDSRRIAKISNKYGAETPFIRSKKLADDFTGTVEVISHAIKWLNKQDQEPKVVCCIYACAPFIRSSDIKIAFNKFKKTSPYYQQTGGGGETDDHVFQNIPIVNRLPDEILYSADNILFPLDAIEDTIPITQMIFDMMLFLSTFIGMFVKIITPLVQKMMKFGMS